MQYHRIVPHSYVLDTNVLVAALRSRTGASRQLLLAALERRFVLLAAVPLFMEYEAVLSRPENLKAFGITRIDMEAVLDDLASVVKPVHIAYRWRPQLPDANDEMVLETAANGNAKAIVTFNRRDFVRAATQFHFSILLPSEAWRELGGINR